jgi:hypothetical protein
MYKHDISTRSISSHKRSVFRRSKPISTMHNREVMLPLHLRTKSFKDYQEDSQSFTSLGKASERHLESAGSSRPEFTRMEDKITRHLSIAGDVCTSEKYIRLGCTIPWTHAIPLARTNQ